MNGIKSFTSYADVANVESAINKKYPIIDLKGIQDNTKIVISDNIKSLPVIDEENNYIGVFQINKAYDNMIDEAN